MFSFLHKPREQPATHAARFDPQDGHRLTGPVALTREPAFTNQELWPYKVQADGRAAACLARFMVNNDPNYLKKLIRVGGVVPAGAEEIFIKIDDRSSSVRSLGTVLVEAENDLFRPLTENRAGRVLLWQAYVNDLVRLVHPAGAVDISQARLAKEKDFQLAFVSGAGKLHYGSALSDGLRFGAGLAAAYRESGCRLPIRVTLLTDGCNDIWFACGKNNKLAEAWRNKSEALAAEGIQKACGFSDVSIGLFGFIRAPEDKTGDAYWAQFERFARSMDLKKFPNNQVQVSRVMDEELMGRTVRTSVEGTTRFLGTGR